MPKHTLYHFQFPKVSKKAFLKRIPILIFLFICLVWAGLTYLESELKFQNNKTQPDNNKIVDQKNQTQSKVIFDSKSQTVTFSKADTNFQLNTHYSNSDLFDSGISRTGRFASTNILPNSKKSQIEVVTYDFETESFLTIDNKFSSMLRQISLENDTTTVKHYWSPTDDELFLLVIGMYQKSRLFKLHVDDSNTKLVLEKEFSFTNSQDISVDGWSNDGTSFSISIIEEVENVPNTGAIRVIKTRNATIFKDNSYRYEDE